jgi:hypothetical protein
MAQQQLDFGFDQPSLPVILRAAADADSRYFWTMQETARLLKTSASEVWWLIVHYRLDALLVCGEYRIPWTAICRLIDDKKRIQEQFNCYQCWTTYRQVKFFLELRAGADVRNAMQAQNVPPELVQAMLRRKLPDPQMWSSSTPGQILEPDQEDWYELHALDLPTELLADDWAGLLRVGRGMWLLETGLESGALVGWPEVYDLLIEREVVNLPAGYRIPGACQKETADGQLELG